MPQLLLIDDDAATLDEFAAVLRAAGYRVVLASCGHEILDILDHQHIDAIICELQLRDMSSVGVLRLDAVRRTRIPVIALTERGRARDAVPAIRAGAADFLEKPVPPWDLLRTVATALPAGRDEMDGADDCRRVVNISASGEAHAAARWARTVVAMIDARTDPRTLADWSGLVFVSRGALRSWCRIGGISPRRSLVFARLLRAAGLSDRGRHKLENLLDVVDRRTLDGLLALAGLDATTFPRDVEEFLERQTLVRDPDTLSELRRAVRHRREEQGRALRSG